MKLLLLPIIVTEDMGEDVFLVNHYIGLAMKVIP